jgi:hypothetical protein
MFKLAHFIDIVIRSFFLFIAIFVPLNYFAGYVLSLIISLLTVAGVNLLLELTSKKEYKTIKITKHDFKVFFIKMFDRSKTKNYLFIGILLLFMSFIVKLNIYYIIFSSIVFIFAFLTRCGIIKLNENKAGGQKDDPKGEADSKDLKKK